MDAPPPALSASDQEFLLRQARESILQHAESGGAPTLNETDVSPAAREQRACFVTLTRNGKLRGCIGNLQAREPLYQAVMENARSAAFRDARFAPVELGEVPELGVEISVLTKPAKLSYQSPEELAALLRPGVDGVILSVSGRTATFLPQVWEKLPGAERFLGALSEKAGLPPEAWHRPDAVVQIYQVESFTSRPMG